jgi:hypothetical protein
MIQPKYQTLHDLFPDRVFGIPRYQRNGRLWSGLGPLGKTFPTNAKTEPGVPELSLVILTRGFFRV